MKKHITLSFLALAAVLQSASVAKAAEMLAAENGMTLYVFDKDTEGVSNCYDACAVNWPPYQAKEGDAMKKDWTMLKRKDGNMQWAYDGKPMYFFKNDKAKGDKTGDGMGSVWHIVMD